MNLSTDLAVSQNGTPNMGVSVAAGTAFVKGTSATFQGLYHVFNDAAKSITLAAADATNPRIDLIVARIRDAAYVAGSSNTWTLEAVTGAAIGATPFEPPLPVSSLLLATVNVPAGATSITNANITDRRPLAPLRGREVAVHVMTSDGPSLAATEHDSGLSITFVMPYLAAGQKLALDASGDTIQFGAVNSNGVRLGALITKSDNSQISGAYNWAPAGISNPGFPFVRGFITNSDVAAGTRVTLKVRIYAFGYDAGNANRVLATPASPAVFQARIV